VALPPGLAVPSRYETSTALRLAREALDAEGFRFDLTAGLAGRSGASRNIVLTDRAPDSEECSGTTEIVGVHVSDAPPGSMLRLTCVTQILGQPVHPGGACGHEEMAGCPARGDRALARIALEAVSSL
jgi:hypothetical protein